MVSRASRAKRQIIPMGEGPGPMIWTNSVKKWAGRSTKDLPSCSGGLTPSHNRNDLKTTKELAGAVAEAEDGVRTLLQIIPAIGVGRLNIGRGDAQIAPDGTMYLNRSRIRI